MLSDEYLKVVIAMADRERQITDADRIRSVPTRPTAPGRLRRWFAGRQPTEPAIGPVRAQPARTATDPSA